MLIVGGGIAGLAAAWSATAAGIAVTLLEQAPQFRPVGAGITLSANALAALDRLGVGDAVRAAGRPITTATMTDAAGRSISWLEFSGEPLTAIDRSALHACLLAGLDVELRLATTVTAVRQRADAVEVDLADGSTHEAQMVIGADGLRSAVRATLLGSAAPRVRYAGYTCWRMVTADRQGLDVAVEQWGRGRRIGLVPLPDQRCYAFLTANAGAGAAEPGSAAGLRARFSDFGGPAGRLLATLDDDTHLLRHDIEELDGVAFGAGRVALIGDAAHAMTPNLGQGAGQGLEDALVLGRALATHPVDEAVAAYATQRRERVRRLQRRSRSMGRMGQLANPVLVRTRDRLMRATPTAVLQRQQAQVVDPGLRLARSEPG